MKTLTTKLTRLCVLLAIGQAALGCEGPLDPNEDAGGSGSAGAPATLSSRLERAGDDENEIVPAAYALHECLSVNECDRRANNVSYTLLPQENTYYCGPAATYTALSAQLPNVPSHAELATELHTTTDGTDNIGLVASTLNNRLGSHYVRRDIPGAYTDNDKNDLRLSLYRAIDSGFALVANVKGVATDDNGQQHRFDGGHYVAVVGYSARDSALIADSAFQRRADGSYVEGTYYMSIEQLTYWIANKGYTAFP